MKKIFLLFILLPFLSYSQNQKVDGVKQFTSTPIFTKGIEIKEPTYSYKEELFDIRNNLSSFYRQIFYRSDYGYYNFKPLNNLAPIIYLMPNGAVTGTTCKFVMFNNDYSNDYNNYNGFNIFTNNVENRINIGANRGILGGARMAMRIYGDYKGSVAANDSNSIDFLTNNDLILNQFTGAIGFGTTNTDPFGIGLANQFTFKDPSTQVTRLNVVGNSAAAGIYFGRNNIRTASVATQSTTSDLDISTNPTNAGISLTSNVRIFASTGNVRIGGTAADNNVDKLQVNGTISATAGSNPNNVVVNSQLQNGNYTPTLTPTNATGVSLLRASFVKVGNVVNARLSIEFTPTSTTNAINIACTLPFARATSVANNMGGLSAINLVTYKSGMCQSITTTTVNLNVFCDSLVSSSMVANFQYSILD